MLLEQVEAQLLRYTTFRLHMRSIGDRGMLVTALCAWPVSIHVWRRGGPWVMSDGRATFRLVPELRAHSEVAEYLEQHSVRDVGGELERTVDDEPAGAFLAFADLLSTIIFVLRLAARGA